jgi:hypothetical protein
MATTALILTTAFGEDRVIEYSCGVSGPGSPTTPDGEVPKVKVWELAESDQLQLPPGADSSKHTVACARSLLVPSPNDVKVLNAGFKLFIGARGKSSGEDRIATFFGKKPNLVFVVITGEATPAEIRRTNAVMKAMNAT